ncbi:MAG TPA: cyclomaltodextrinase C-terminal domain-containing protein, partial [Lentimicrobium sp.]|nr:cyclomaltodextrinase C-terminal domain-containing protein [Lentimicrobium sp.]
SYYQKDSPLSRGYNSHLPSVTDFPLYGAMQQAFTEKEGWSEGMARLYYVLAQDFLFSDPYRNLIFLDNHDLNRYYNTIRKDKEALKRALAFMLTTRGIPQIYYGTELLMDGEEHKGHGEIRRDFPGGWAGDPVNAFTREGRTPEQNEVFDYMQKILQWRKNSKAVANGRLTHFIPENGIYVYFRTADEESVMVIVNNSKEERMLETERFREALAGYQQAHEVITSKTIDVNGRIKVGAESAMILELKK